MTSTSASSRLKNSNSDGKVILAQKVSSTYLTAYSKTTSTGTADPVKVGLAGTGNIGRVWGYGCKETNGDFSIYLEASDACQRTKLTTADSATSRRSNGEATGNDITDTSETSFIDDNRRSCCRTCTSGKACGNSCISSSKACYAGSGCACNGGTESVATTDDVCKSALSSLFTSSRRRAGGGGGGGASSSGSETDSESSSSSGNSTGNFGSANSPQYAYCGIVSTGALVLANYV